MSKSNPQAKPKPAPQPSRRARMAPDLRQLPLPEPYDKNDPHPSRSQRHQDEWTWDAWRDWLFDAASRKWHKPSIRRVLKLRVESASVCLEPIPLSEVALRGHSGQGAESVV